MAIYKINSTDITVSAVNTIISQNVTLEVETHELLTGQIFDANGTTPIEGAAVILYKKLKAEPFTETQESIAYTDANGEYGFPYNFDTDTYSYNLKVYTPNTAA